MAIANGGAMVMDYRKRSLKMDLAELCYALDDGSHEHTYFLDLDTGELLLISDYVDTEEAEGLRDRLDEDPDRYELVPKVISYEGYRDMEDFIATVEDKHLGELLEVAITGKGAFRRFKDVLAHYAEERERWFHFKDDRLMERALEWLEDIGVELI